ncbi:MAG: ankyrin repeat domain-containing protein [Spirochaetes bacterium]|nr:ankyrin repeat domain-containing protein [Spirochaetota bacterium]
METMSIDIIPNGTILIDRYTVTKSIAEGEHTKTYCAYDEKGNREVILKIFFFSFIKEWSTLDCFEKEIKILKNLNYAYIPKYIDDFQCEVNAEKIHALVSAYIASENLHEIIHRGHKFLLPDILQIFTNVIKILAYLHSLHPPVIHRDINPKNLLLDKNGNVYLIDFYFASNPWTDQAVSSAIFVGTPGYTIIEQYTNAISLSEDVYSLGATVLFLLTGRNPDEFERIEGKIDYGKYSSIPAYFSSLIDKMIEPDSRKRLQSINDVSNLLNEMTPTKEEEEEEAYSNVSYFSCDDFGRTPLMMEIINNNEKSARNLIERGSDVNAVDTEGISILGHAVINNNEKIIRLLCSNKSLHINPSNPNVIDTLILASRHNNHGNIGKLLLAHGKYIDSKDNDGKTALDYAIINRNAQLIKLLVDNGAELHEASLDDEYVIEALKDGKAAEEINKIDNQGRTALMIAIHEYEDLKAKILIAQGADLNAQDKKGRTSLIYTIWHERFAITELLINKGAELNIQDNKGMSALTWAVDRKYSKIAKLLIKNGADGLVKDKQGNTLAHYATTKKTISILSQAGLPIQ